MFDEYILGLSEKVFWIKICSYFEWGTNGKSAEIFEIFGQEPWNVQWLNKYIVECNRNDAFYYKMGSFCNKKGSFFCEKGYVNDFRDTFYGIKGAFSSIKGAFFAGKGCGNYFRDAFYNRNNTKKYFKDSNI